MNNPILIDHPVLRHKLGRLRDRSTGNFEFARVMKEITTLMMYDVTRDLTCKTIALNGEQNGVEISKLVDPPVLVPLLRAGNGMIEGAREVLQRAPVGHIGIYRDRTINCTVEYFLKLPDTAVDNGVILLDPVIGTADSMIACIKRLEQMGMQNIIVLTLLASKMGMQNLMETCPSVAVFTLDASDDLSEEGDLIPGMGDVSARIYNYD